MLRGNPILDIEAGTMMDFTGVRYHREVILYSVFSYVRYGASYRDLEEIMAEPGVSVDHATLNQRFVVDATAQQKNIVFPTDIASEL